MLVNLLGRLEQSDVKQTVTCRLQNCIPLLERSHQMS